LFAGEREALDGDQHLPVTQRRHSRPHHPTPRKIARNDLERDFARRPTEVR
jgi:hypothetical protein